VSPRVRASTDQVRIIDWHDGVVSALATLHGCAGWFYVSLLAWHQGLGERTYVLVPLDDASALRFGALVPETLRSANHERWEGIQREVGRLRAEHGGPVRVVRCRSLRDEDASWKTVDFDERLRRQLGQTIEAALDEEAAERWLEVFASPNKGA
jgi:hypothetical protein